MIIDKATGLAAERLDRIRNLLRSRPMVRVDELSRELRVSEPTVRRDLSELVRRGWVRRVHGGAASMDSHLQEPVFDDKTAIAAEEKLRIARAALERVKPSDSVFLDGGSTILALARLMVPMATLTVVTNSLRVASLYASGGPRMILTGGEFRGLSQTLVGYLTRPLIEQLRVDEAFIGTIGLTPDGLTTTDPREAETKQLVMQHARRVTVLAHSGKIGKTSFVKFGSLDQVDLLITDSGIPRDMLRNLRKYTDVLTV
jgi:DeoR family transcriptional regulator, fructose operon transcriptional repressor